MSVLYVSSRLRFFLSRFVSFFDLSSTAKGSEIFVEERQETKVTGWRRRCHLRFMEILGEKSSELSDLISV